jgi:transcriptional regulator with XRE-family HTH domain
MIRDDIAEVLKKLRKDLGISQIKMAKKLGVSFAAYSVWERGGGLPNYANVVKIQEVVQEVSRGQVND